MLIPLRLLLEVNGLLKVRGEGFVGLGSMVNLGF